MADIINFNKARKARARADAERQAAENRVRHGLGKAQKEQDRRESELAESRLDQLRRERRDEETE
ncbi:MAG: DUF4169 family protein [Solimonas sp.]